MTESNHPTTPSADRHISAYPPGLTYHNLVARNKRNTVLLVILMTVLVVLVGEVIVAAMFGFGVTESGPVAAQNIPLEPFLLTGVICIALTGVAGTWSYFQGGQTILRISGAQPLEKKDDPQLYNVVEEMALSAGLPMPKIYRIDSPALNAFATGRDPAHAAVAITTGLRKTLSRDELAGVMAHELAHIRHYDIRLTMMMATMVGLIVLACDVFLRATIWGGAGRRYRSSGGGRGKGGGQAVLIVIALILAIVAPLLAKMIQLAVSRQREYLADAGAVELTRYPKGLADALRKLAADSTKLEQASRATAHLYIVNPILNARGRENLASVFSTHPPVHDRIARIEALMR